MEKKKFKLKKWLSVLVFYVLITGLFVIFFTKEERSGNFFQTMFRGYCDNVGISQVKDIFLTSFGLVAIYYSVLITGLLAFLFKGEFYSFSKYFTVNFKEQRGIKRIKTVLLEYLYLIAEGETHEV